MKKIRGNKKETSINDLAVMVAKGFDGVHKEMGEVKSKIKNVEGRLGNIESRLGSVEENLKATRQDVLNVGDRFVPRYEFDDLRIRFNRLEQRVKGK